MKVMIISDISNVPWEKKDKKKLLLGSEYIFFYDS